jgi:hypothetical protein
LFIAKLRQEKKGFALSDEAIRHKAQAFSATSNNPDAQAGLSTSWLEKFKHKNNLMGARSRKGSLAQDDADDTSLTASTSHSPNNGSPTSRHASSSPLAEDTHEARNNDDMRSQIPSGYSEMGRGNPFRSDSHASLNSAFTETLPSFSPTPLSPLTSPFFTPDSGTAPGPFVAQHPRQSLQTNGVGQNHMNANVDSNAHANHRPRSQTFPFLDYNMSDAVSSVDPPTPKYMTSNNYDSPMQELADPLPNLNSAVHGMPSGNRMQNMTPSELMRPPPLPSNVNVPRSLTPASSSAMSGTSPEEARKAMEVVLSFFEQQPNGFLDMQESITVGKLMEKLRLQTRAG